jgi:hypothetical protein
MPVDSALPTNSALPDQVGHDAKANSIVGIIVVVSIGIALAINAIAAAFVLVSRRRKRQEQVLESSRKPGAIEIGSAQIFEADHFVFTPKELDGAEQRVELDATSSAVELPANSKDPG